MSFLATLVGAPADVRTTLSDLFPGAAPQWSADESDRAVVDIPIQEPSDALRAALADRPLDWCLAPAANRKKRLLLADMDSTIIGCECVDEMADVLGVGPQVAEITERAMQGELEFEGALRERVALLAGLTEERLATLYEERVRLNPGARALLATMRAHGAECVLVTGGFVQIAERVAAAAGFNDFRANALEVVNGVLSGRLDGPILGPDAKHAELMSRLSVLSITAADVIAIGDGANDAPMITAAGLGVGYRPKPLLAAIVDGRIQSGDLRSALFFQGFRPEEIVEPD